MRFINIITIFLITTLSLNNFIAQPIDQVIYDINGNEYESIILNNGQEWLTSNLRATTFNDGTELAMITDNEIWSTTSSPSYCFYQNNPTNSDTYGNLYNFFVISADKNICPIGWRVPTESDWSELTSSLGGLGLAGGKLKFEGFDFWSTPNTDATNEIRFDALPNGCRYNGGFFNNLNYYSFLWTASELDTTYAWFRSLKYDNGTTVRNFSKKQSGYGIRCMRNSSSEIIELDNESCNIYPNPTNGFINVHFSNIQEEEINFSLLDQMGKIIERGQLQNNMLDFSNVDDGLFVLRFEYLNKIITFKLCKL
ncbi:MAG: T9SS type A sorting domain-containing protein [Bacteroidetes bacterium]|nr:T9SS type A sorting domain-containing protein [Bacteroidota bacterium]